MLFGASLLSANVGLIVWLSVIFLVTLLILRRYAWGPITSALSEREETIASSLNRAEEALAESQRLQESNAQAKREVEQEAQKLLREARDEAQSLRDRQVERTREEITSLREQALLDIERDKERALQSLRDEVADLAILAAEKILQGNINSSSQRALVSQFIDDLTTSDRSQSPSAQA
ncbi:MAG: F0F1 ATP synthase subunit B [Bacteroidetes bacterium]|nr:F0F1 ATP synthase subunit B [Bacteroidota bacterium]MCY4225869.1 F0F1 ATP synthase subunit B [Bacteroidota bacterium]